MSKRVLPVKNSISGQEGSSSSFRSYLKTNLATAAVESEVPLKRPRLSPGQSTAPFQPVPVIKSVTGFHDSNTLATTGSKLNSETQEEIQEAGSEQSQVTNLAGKFLR